ncbi:FAD-dependent thymidylate synthase [Leadbettera azotonutricia]|uniref:Flavin-dependent thymidylate synthase n=1 Tax=Leadbettera azotonutricia (strain ATCC BAA-888 / DSM 13862 / ZAS-9) TaxID=545695 RepID=F5YC22_LEAAZ|nr:FAD-dependent thymidylate synthase [Leadbettera azotonutricia]AEF81768.1 thymidylate synthase, flavin-dependent [Leadbettera azotonutricia ZAS-9]
MAHCATDEAEAILDKEFKVLDKGFVRLVDYLGGDKRVVQSARVSYREGTKSYREDAGLIDYLLRNRHTSPFEQVILTFHIKLPVFIARQWIRHRTARLNEISGRYSVLKDDFYVPDPADVALQSPDNKQGRSPEAVDEARAAEIIGLLDKGQQRSYADYSALINEGIARELARINLPLSLYTEWYWQIDLHNLFHFLELRLDTHAQKEIRLYAGVLLDMAKKVAPLCCESFGRHMLGGVNFSKDELAELKRRLAGEAPGLTGKHLERFEEKLKSGRQL